MGLFFSTSPTSGGHLQSPVGRLLSVFFFSSVFVLPLRETLRSSAVSSFRWLRTFPGSLLLQNLFLCECRALHKISSGVSQTFFFAKERFSLFIVHCRSVGPLFVSFLFSLSYLVGTIMFTSLIRHPLKMRGSLRPEKKKILPLSSTITSSSLHSSPSLLGEQASSLPRRDHPRSPSHQTEHRRSSSLSTPAIPFSVTAASSTWCLSRDCLCTASSTSPLCSPLFPVLESRRYTTLMRKVSRLKAAGNRRSCSRESVSQSHFTLLPCRAGIPQPLLQSVSFFSSTAGPSPSSSSHLHRLPQNNPKRHASPSPPPPSRVPVLSIEEVRDEE